MTDAASKATAISAIGISATATAISAVHRTARAITMVIAAIVTVVRAIVSTTACGSRSPHLRQAQSSAVLCRRAVRLTAAVTSSIAQAATARTVLPTTHISRTMVRADSAFPTNS